jgi:hypothetical protein
LIIFWAMTNQKQNADLDGPWKEALDEFLESMLAFFFPDIHADIDWSRSYETLDKEFQQIVNDAEIGKRLADKLFRVWTINGREQWLLIHVEVQGDYQGDFEERIFVYNIRAFQKYNHPVVSLVILTDDNPQWRPDHYEYGQWGSSTGIKFPIIKLIDLAKDTATLERSDNPFATVVLAHLKMLETRGAPATRSQWKLRLVKGLYERKWPAERVRQLFRLIDWIMILPSLLEEDFRESVFQYEKEKHMPYVTSIERLAKKEGHEEGLEQGLVKGREEGREEGLRIGLQDGIVLALKVKFGPEGKKLGAKIKRVQNLALLQTLKKKIQAGRSLEQLSNLLQ